MSFSGKKYRRTHCDNIHALLRETTTSAQTMHLLTSKAPIFSFIRLDEKTFLFKLILESRVMSHKFRLGEEFEMEIHNGNKIKMIYTLDGEDVLNQTVKLSNGKIAHFRREFGAVNRMIVTMETGQSAVIYYELVN